MRVRSRTLLICIVASLLAIPGMPQAQQSGAAALALENARRKEIIDGDLAAAVKLYKEILSKYPAARSVSAEALVGMARSYQKSGDAEARHSYERVLKEFPEQTAATGEAQVRLAALITVQSQGQDVGGNWQGTLEVGARKLRLVLRIRKTAGGWNGTMLSIGV